MDAVCPPLLFSPVASCSRLWSCCPLSSGATCKATTGGNGRGRVKVAATVASERAGSKLGDEDSITQSRTGTVVIGGGLAGLAAATQLASQEMPFLLLEASDGVGGRVRTDILHGFLLDRGFQIFITGYPEARRILKYDALHLSSFYAGALVWYNGAFHRVADPFRHFADGVASLASPIGSFLDKLLVGIARFKAVARSDEAILSAKETSIQKRLLSEGFSSSIIDRFFRPFFGGIFFDNELQTTSRLYDFVFKCLAQGSNTLPAKGIGAIPQQIADALPQSSILLNSKVEEIVWGQNGLAVGVKLTNGRLIKSDYGVILAVEGPEASRLLEKKLQQNPSISKSPRSTVCIYFSTENAPIREPILLLNGSGKGIVNNMFFPSTVAPSYAPSGKTLVSVTLIGCHEKSTDEDLEREVREELRGWFGERAIATWEHLRTYRIKYAQPDQTPPTDLRKDPTLGFSVYVCGDHRDSSTFDGALTSGKRAALALLKDAKFVLV